MVSNPPYFPVGTGPVSPSKARAAARGETDCTLDDICRAAAFLCRSGGTFCMVHKPERLAQIIAAGAAVGLEAKRLCLLRHKEGRPVPLVLIHCRKGGKPGLIIEEAALFDTNNAPTVFCKNVYHRE